MSYLLIETQTDLFTTTEALRKAPIAAFDMEADSFHHYRPKVCMMQLTFDHTNYLVDPLAELDLKEFLETLSCKELIIHDAGYDLRMLNGDYGFEPGKPIFDTMIAAGLAGMKNVGLSAMMNQVLGAPTSKHHQKADWSKRPLADYLLEYAAIDTACLPQIKEYLEEKLVILGRLEWHEESCRNAVRMALMTKEPPVEEDLWRVKNSGMLKPREMAFLRQLWNWRESIARRTNIAPFMILRNEDLVKLAVWGAHRRKAVDDETELPIRHVRRYAKSLMTELTNAQNLPPDQWPGPRKSEPSKKLSDKTRRVVNLLKDECENIARELDLPLNLIASRQSLTRIVLNNAVTLEQIQKKELLLNWQAKLLIPAIQKILG
jgi:ribonuclease D